MAIKDYMKHGLALLLISGTALGAGSEYYDHTTFPAQGSAATSAGMRAELDAVEAGFDKLPALTGNGGKVVRINSGATAQEAVTQATVVGEAIDGATDKATPVDADEIGLVDSAASNVLKSLTWANLKATIKSYYDAVASTLTNKIINLTSNTLTGTTAQFNTALSDGDCATLAATGTLTGKTINLTSNTLVATSAQLATAVTDETGSGALVFGTSPTISSPTISGGTINNAAIGGTTPAAGAFTTLSSSGSATLGDAGTDTHTINGLAVAIKTYAGAATVPFGLKNSSGTANTEVILDLDPTGNDVGVRSGQVAARTDGSNQVTMIFKVSSGNVPAERLLLSNIGTLYPAADGTQNLGDASYRWNALYTEAANVYGNANVLSATGLLGYGTGAGGTVTQATSKSTAVTLNKPVGQITTNNAALGGTSSETFTLNNSLITTTSIVHVSVSGNANHRANVESVDLGTALIRITNTTALSKSEAVNINFIVFSGATS